jgi:hypothetical protein
MLLPTPHADGGMVGPAGRFDDLLAYLHTERAKDLLAFNALFAEATVIKALRGLSEVCVRKECLHVRVPVVGGVLHPYSTPIATQMLPDALDNVKL